MRKLILSIASVSVLASACTGISDWPRQLDSQAFEGFGGTFFSKPTQLTIKEVHLDQGALSGRDIIVVGQVKEISDHFTYMVLEDSSARVLVLLTNLDQAGPWLRNHHPTTLRVLGRVEGGKKGLPLVRARALNDKQDTTAPTG